MPTLAGSPYNCCTMFGIPSLLDFLFMLMRMTLSTTLAAYSALNHRYRNSNSISPPRASVTAWRYSGGSLTCAGER